MHILHTGTIPVTCLNRLNRVCYASFDPPATEDRESKSAAALQIPKPNRHQGQFGRQHTRGAVVGVYSRLPWERQKNERIRSQLRDCGARSKLPRQMQFRHRLPGEAGSNSNICNGVWPEHALTRRIRTQFGDSMAVGV